jgi:hypothetical protein
MMLEGEEYSRRLAEFSDSTMQLIMDIDSISKENACKCDEITSNSELTEEQVVAELLKLKEGK